MEKLPLQLAIRIFRGQAAGSVHWIYSCVLAFMVRSVSPAQRISHLLTSAGKQLFQGRHERRNASHCHGRACPSDSIRGSKPTPVRFVLLTGVFAHPSMAPRKAPRRLSGVSLKTSVRGLARSRIGREKRPSGMTMLKAVGSGPAMTTRVAHLERGGIKTQGTLFRLKFSGAA